MEKRCIYACPMSMAKLPNYKVQSSSTFDSSKAQWSESFTVLSYPLILHCCRFWLNLNISSKLRVGLDSDLVKINVAAYIFKLLNLQTIKTSDYRHTTIVNRLHVKPF